MNRKQRRFAASTKGRKKMVDEKQENGEAKEPEIEIVGVEHEDPSKRMRARQEYINDLLTGSEKPMNEYAGDLVKQMRNARGESTQLRSQLDKLEADIQAIKDRRIVLEGLVQNLGMFLIKWKEDNDREKRKQQDNKK